MQKTIAYLGYKIEIYFDQQQSGYILYDDNTFIESALGFKGSNFQSNGLIQDAKTIVDGIIAKKRLKKLQRLRKIFSKNVFKH